MLPGIPLVSVDGDEALVASLKELLSQQPDLVLPMQYVVGAARYAPEDNDRREEFLKVVAKVFSLGDFARRDLFSVVGRPPCPFHGPETPLHSRG